MQDTEHKAVQNEWFSERIGKKYLVTTRHGGFAFLDDGEYARLWNGTFQENEALLEKLTNAGIALVKEQMPEIVRSFQKKFLFAFAPKVYMINMSNECNLGCIYCFANATQKSAAMSKENLENTCSFIVSSPEKEFSIEFQGGEPLAKFGMIKEFVKTIRHHAERSSKKIHSIVIVTNMTLMTEEIANYILENNIGFCSSLDGPEILHDMHRSFLGGGGSYNVITKWLAYFRERGKTINLMPTITSYSLKFDASAIIDEHRRWGSRRITFRPVYRVGRATNNESMWLQAEEFIQYRIKGIEYMVSLSEKGEIIYDVEVQAMLKNILGFPQAYMCMRKPCGAGVSQLSVSPDGSIFPCDLAKTMPELSVGNVKENYYDVVARTLQFIVRTCEFQPLCDTCTFGAYCGTCFTRTYAAFKDSVSRTPRDFDCKVNKAMFRYLFEKLQDERYRKIFELWAKQRR